MDHETYWWYIRCIASAIIPSPFPAPPTTAATKTNPSATSYTMGRTFPVDVIRNRCFICEDNENRPCSPAPSIPDLDIQFSDAETIVVNEFLEDVGLASVEIPRHMIPTQFASGYDLRGYASLDIFEDLRVQATYFPFMPVNYVHWLDYAIPLSRFFFVDEKWISWRDARRWDQEDQKQYEAWNAEKKRLSIETESLKAQDNRSYDPPSPFKRPSRVPLGLFSIPSIEDTKRRRTIYYARPPLIRANADAMGVGEFGRTGWNSTLSLSSASETSQFTHKGSDNTDSVRRFFHIPIAMKFEDIQERLRKAFHATD